MKLFLIVYLIANVMTDDSKESFVHILTESNIDQFLSDNPLSLVKFYAPWCGHCKDLAPEFEKAAIELSYKESTVKLGKVDATVEHSLAVKHNIAGYPTMLFFRNGKSEEYQGGRTSETIISWIENVTGPSIHLVKDLGQVKSESKTSYVLLSWGSDEDLDLFTDYADNHRMSGQFYVIEDGKDETKKTMKVLARRKDEEDTTSKELNHEEFKEFVKWEELPLFGPINSENFMLYHPRDNFMVWLCSDNDYYKSHYEKIADVAKKYRVGLTFLWLDIDQYRIHAEEHLGVSSFPKLVMKYDGSRYILENSSTDLEDEEKIIKFIEDVKNNKIERVIKSEPIPKENTQPVKVVVGNSFEEIVINSNKDVMLTVYAPWCGHCKKFSPIYEEVAERVKDMDNVIIAKMDGVLNESPTDKFYWRGFPTIFYLKAGEKEPVKYQGLRTVDAIVDYIKKNSSQPIPMNDVKDEL